MKRFKKLSDFSQPLNEGNLAGLTNAHPWEEISKMGTKLIKGQPIQLTALLFGTGVDRIDVNSTPFQDAVQIVKWLYIQSVKTYQSQTPLKGTLIIRGSASAVGTSSGYDNFALAQRRAKNLFDALEVWYDKNHPKTEVDQATDWHCIEKYVPIKQEAVVGSATRKGSPEALAEQCVYLIWVPVGQHNDFQYDLVQPIDNVRVVLPKPPISTIVPVGPDPGFSIKIERCGCCGRPFTQNDRYSWVMQRYNWSLNELKNGWLKTKMGDTVYSWLLGMSKK